jgi:hypothetical protein
MVLTLRQFGYLFVLTVFVTAMWIILKIFLFIFKQGSGKKIAIQTCLLTVTFLAIGFVYQTRINKEQHELNRLVKRIEAYKVQHGTFPGKLEDIDISYQQKSYIRYGVSYIRYGVSNEMIEPRLFYTSSFQTIDGGYLYDFKKHAWIYAKDYVNTIK